MNGADVLLLVNTGTEQTPTWTAVGSQTGVTFNEKTDEIDVSAKDSRNKRVIAGRYSATVALDALYVPSDTAFGALKTAMRSGTLIKIQRKEGGTPTETASALITGLSSEVPYQGAATVGIELAIDGGWTAVVPAPQEG